MSFAWRISGCDARKHNADGREGLRVVPREGLHVVFRASFLQKRRVAAGTSPELNGRILDVELEAEESRPLPPGVPEDVLALVADIGKTQPAGGESSRSSSRCRRAPRSTIGRIDGCRADDGVVRSETPMTYLPKFCSEIARIPRQLPDQIGFARQLPVGQVGLIIVQEPPDRIELFPGRLRDAAADRRRPGVGAGDPGSARRGLLGREPDRNRAQHRQRQSHFDIGGRSSGRAGNEVGRQRVGRAQISPSFGREFCRSSAPLLVPEETWLFRAPTKAA